MINYPQGRVLGITVPPCRIPGREEFRHGGAVALVFGVLGGADLLGKGGAALEQHHQQKRTDDAPVEKPHAGADGEQVEGHPRALLGKIVGMAAAAPKAHRVEALPVGLRQLLQLLPLAYHLPLGALEGPLLLVGNCLIHNESQHQDGGKCIHPAEGLRGIHAHQSREGGHQHQRILVDAHEKEVEESPGPALVGKRRAATDDTPAVILRAFPEFEPVGPLAGEVEGEAGAPERGQDGHDNQPRGHAAACGNHPGVGDGKQAPELVHLGIVAGELSQHKAPEGAAGGYDTEGFEGVQLGCGECGPHKDIEQRTDDERHSQQGAHQGDVHFHRLTAFSQCLQLFERTGELVGAAGAAALAVDALQEGDEFFFGAALAKPGKALRVAVAALGVLHLADGIPFGFNVYLLRAHGCAGLEGGPADAALGGIGNQDYFIHGGYVLACKYTNIFVRPCARTGRRPRFANPAQAEAFQVSVGGHLHDSLPTFSAVFDGPLSLEWTSTDSTACERWVLGKLQPYCFLISFRLLHQS